jgi:hypothetical protein
LKFVHVVIKTPLGESHPCNGCLDTPFEFGLQVKTCGALSEKRVVASLIALTFNRAF